MTDSGWLHVITGPMYSGKTEALIRLISRYSIAGKKVGLFKPTIDTRTEKVASRNGLDFPATPVKNWLEVSENLRYNPVDVIAIDEIQFFKDANIADSLNFLAFTFQVLVTGLDKDFLGRPFEPMERLLAYADEVDKLTSICFICKDAATMTQRLINGQPAKSTDPLILIGGMGDDTYEARCREHHQIGH